MTNQLQTMIQNLCDKADHPARTVFETIKESGRKAVGWVEPYAPVEIIDAAGAIPIGLWGGEIDLKKRVHIYHRSHALSCSLLWKWKMTTLTMFSRQF